MIIQVSMAQLQNAGGFGDSEIPTDEVLTVIEELIRTSHKELNDWVQEDFDSRYAKVTSKKCEKC
jgi:hypothetical protein